MKIKNKIIPIILVTILICVAVLSLLFLRQIYENDFNKSPSEMTGNDIFIPDINTQQGLEASFLKSYNNIKDLQNDAYAIVTGDVIKSDEDVRYNDHIDIAISEVRIIDCYLGGLQTGDVISIEETGVRNDKGDISIDGVPLLKEHMRVLLFLTEPSDVVQQTRSGYGILGSYQGKFFIDKNDFVYASTDFSDQVTPLFELGNALSLSEFEEILSTGCGVSR